MFRLIDGYAVQAACWFQNSLAGLQKRLSILSAFFVIAECRRASLFRITLAENTETNRRFPHVS